MYLHTRVMRETSLAFLFCIVVRVFGFGRMKAKTGSGENISYYRRRKKANHGIASAAFLKQQVRKKLAQNGSVR